MDFIGSIVSGLFMLLVIMGAVYFIATNPAFILVGGGILLGAGILLWPLIQKIL